jgi:hypothetical protein
LGWSEKSKYTCEQETSKYRVIPLKMEVECKYWCSIPLHVAIVVLGHSTGTNPWNPLIHLWKYYWSSIPIGSVLVEFRPPRTQALVSDKIILEFSRKNQKKLKLLNFSERADLILIISLQLGKKLLCF